jgi:diguanylate cyclase (GGDEF)-like protein
MLNPAHVGTNQASEGEASSIRADRSPQDHSATPLDGSAIPPRSPPARTARRLALLGALVVAVIFGATGLLITAEHGGAFSKSLQSTASLAQVLAEQTSRTLQPVDLTLREVLGRLAAGAPNGNPGWNARTMSDLLVERIKALPQVHFLFVIGADGRATSLSHAGPAGGLNVSDRDYFQYLSKNDDHAVFVSGPVQTLSDGQWTIFLARRVNDQRGQFAGVVGAAVTLSYLEDFYRAVTPRDGTVSIVRSDGLILTRSPPEPKFIGAKIPAGAPWYTTVETGGGSYKTSGFLRNVPSIVSVLPVREFPLIIDVTMTQSAALSGWRLQSCWLLVSAAFASACVIFLLRVFGNQYNQLATQNAELETRRLQFDAVLDNMSQGVTFFDVDQTLMISNRRFAELYDLSVEQTRPGTSLAEIIRHRIGVGTFPDMTAADFLKRRDIRTEAGEDYDVTDEFPDGRAVSMHYRPLSGGGWVVTHEDITERRCAQANLVHLARHDPLTQLPNRTLFQERLTQAIAAVGLGTHCALLCLDLDRFKVINDTLGHPVGDGLLRAVAGRLSAIAREADTVARLGGDEFAVILVGLQAPGHAAGLAQRIVMSLSEPYIIDGNQITAGVSIGVSIAPKDGLSSEILLKSADIALYLAKTQGRGTYRFFEPAVDAYVQQQREVEFDLRNARPAVDFELHYQPILDIGRGDVTGFEALIRWNHPVKGLINPAEFIPIAEETGLIVPIGEWALRTACREAASWPAGIEIAVNLSPVQFRGNRLLSVVKEALAASGLDPHRLELEITESVLLENSSARLDLLHQLHALGVRIALDDFGTGYSSLSYLRSFPFGKIKIDRSFIREVDTNKESAAIVGAIVGLGRSLGMTTVAEGIETAQQLAKVRDQGCTRAQGYLFSPPCPANEVPMMIRTMHIPATIPARPPATDAARPPATTTAKSEISVVARS